MFINTCTTTNNETETGTLEVTGTGDIRTRNTGGSSASEGGLGSSSDDDREKGDLSQPGSKSGNAKADDDDPNTFDPVKKSVKEAEKTSGKD